MQPLRYILLLCLIFALLFISVKVYQSQNQKRELKEDLIELSNIKYGLFNVDEWKKMLTNVLAKKIEEFEVTEKNKKHLQSKISSFLYNQISNLEHRYYEENSNGFFGSFSLKNIGAKYFGVFDQLKNDIPIFTNEILNLLNDPKNKKELKAYLTSKLNEYADNTFAKLDYSLHDSIIAKYNCQDRSATILALDNEVKTLQQQLDQYKFLLVIMAIFTAVFLFSTKAISKIEFKLLTSLCFLFLVLGLSLPMIEIDARISEINLSLLGEQIQFKDQVLYYKSKSILEVISLMMKQGGFDLLLVGVLVFIFSVLFPLSKLISALILVSNKKYQSNKLIYFLVHKTGKWSMADVMVVAIFMAYIGFSGILTEQLHQLDMISTKIEILTTNHSSLQIGFFAFASFALLSLLASSKLQKMLSNV